MMLARAAYIKPESGNFDTVKVKALNLSVLKQYFSIRDTHIHKGKNLKEKLNFVASVRERAIPTERPPLVGEVRANFCG
jgi:hypothetical protein